MLGFLIPRKPAVVGKIHRKIRLFMSVSRHDHSSHQRPVQILKADRRDESPARPAGSLELKRCKLSNVTRSQRVLFAARTQPEKRLKQPGDRELKRNEFAKRHEVNLVISADLLAGAIVEI